MYLPRAQRRRVIDAQAFERTGAVRAERIYPAELRDRRAEIVLSCRGSMLAELGEAGCLEGAVAIWSMVWGKCDGLTDRESVGHRSPKPAIPGSSPGCPASR